MATKNLLQYVQQALSIMDSDKVDTINDTEESMQLAYLLEDVYYELMARKDWEFLKGPITLTSASDTDNPTRFSIPEGVRYISSVWYNINEDGDVNLRELKYLEPDEFIRRQSNGTTSNRQLVTDGSQIQYYVENDKQPTYYTSFDDVSVVCDAFNSGVESTLQANKVTARGLSVGIFEIDDEYVPPIPNHMVPLLQHTFNAAASLTFKQTESPADERRAVRQLAVQNRRNSKNVREHYYKNQFGRR